MSYLSKLSSRVEALLKSSHFRANSSFLCADFRLLSVSRRVHCKFYSKKSSEETPKPRVSKKKSKAMEKEKCKEVDEAFYVARRGDAIGFYKSLEDCQAQASSSIFDTPISIFKGSGLQKNAEDYLASRGLKNALYCITAADFKESIFGTLVQCSLHDLASAEEPSKKRSQLEAGLESLEELPSLSTPAELSQKHAKLAHPDILSSSDRKSCILKFDGASKGNPGQSGAGAVLLASDGSLICKLSEGCGKVTNNVAEYRGLRLGLKFALEKGFKEISVQGDSELVCNQVQGLWKAKHKNLTSLYQEVIDFKKKFESFQIVHVLRDKNLDADVAANKGVTLSDGEIVEETP